MDLTIRHLTRYAYQPEAVQAAMRVCLFPPVTEAQRADHWSVEVNGTQCSAMFQDSNGVGVGFWRAPEPVSAIEVVAEGSVRTADLNGVLRGLRETSRPGVFLRQTELTKASERLRELARDISGDGDLARMHALSERVHDAVDYRKDVTGSDTAADDALALGAGVCQDQVHVFVAVARLLEIPARYVVGYLADPESGAPADETHAWAEGYVAGLGWVGFDITNQICPTDLYVRLGCGLDAREAAPLRGTHTGDAVETMSVEIAIEQQSGQSQQ